MIDHLYLLSIYVFLFLLLIFFFLAFLYENGSGGLLLLSLAGSRKAWTNSLFAKSKLPDINSENPPIVSSLGVANVIIGPHIFTDTKFFKVTYPNIQQTQSSASSTESSQQSKKIELIFEFKENPLDQWIFPTEAVVEATTTSAPYEVNFIYRKKVQRS